MMDKMKIYYKIFMSKLIMMINNNKNKKKYLRIINNQKCNNK